MANNHMEKVPLVMEGRKVTHSLGKDVGGVAEAAAPLSIFLPLAPN